MIVLSQEVWHLFVLHAIIVAVTLVQILATIYDPLHTEPGITALEHCQVDPNLPIPQKML